MIKQLDGRYRHEWKTNNIQCAIELNRYWAQKYAITTAINEDGMIYAETKDPIIMWEEVCDSFIAGWVSSARRKQ